MHWPHMTAVYNHTNGWQQARFMRSCLVIPTDFLLCRKNTRSRQLQHHFFRSI